MKVIIRWLLFILFIGFLAVLKNMNMLYRNQNLFLILLLFASGLTVLGIIFFRDGVIVVEEKGPEPEAMALLKKLGEEEKNQEGK